MLIRQVSYGPTAKIFHWLIVALIVVQFLLGWLMPDIHRGMTPGSAMISHISIGVTIMLVMLARVAWRVSHPVAPDASLPGWQVVASESVHWMLYATVITTTITGWLFASARGWAINLYFLIPLPQLVETGSEFGKSIGRYHSYLTWALLVLVAAHILAALGHFFVYKDRVLQRMLP